MTKTTPREYRGHEWINTNTLQPLYSIQARVGKNGWAHLHSGGNPLFYDTAEARDAALKEIQNGR